ncbi:hypothetical protein VTO42DRAFT_1247 [Malbranchea cinnamomea]
MATPPNVPALPIPISLISGRYFLFSADAVAYLRREYNICGVLIGTLPQIPQQNVFLGLPLELMPEEARLLVENQVAYIVDDATMHTRGIEILAEEDRLRYLDEIHRLGRQASLAQASRREQRRDKALQKISKSKIKQKTLSESEDVADNEQQDADGLLFSSSNQQSEDLAPRRASITVDQTFGITPSSSASLFHNPPALSPKFLPEVPRSYPLFAHLHSQGYFLSPGLRFGCQYLAYPGDPLRFHSHFLVSSAEWDEEIDLMDLVAGGRLGTGVKKAYLLGGAEEPDSSDPQSTVRTFSIEWAGM